MATKDQTIRIKRKSNTKELVPNSSNSDDFIFEVSLSTAIASDGKPEIVLPVPKGPLTPDLLDKMNRYWRAANYLCIGQIYLFENPLLRGALKASQIKPRLLGHWGTSPGQNLIYIHLNRLIKEHQADIIYISGPGHGGPSLNACSYLGHVHGSPSGNHTRRERLTSYVSEVFHTRRSSQPLWTACSKFHA